jgi:hypothetical protein
LLWPASRGQGDTLLTLLPRSRCLLAGIVAGRTGGRGVSVQRATPSYPRLWQALRWLLIVAQIALLCWQPVLWLYGEPLTGLGIGLLVADIVALMWLLTNPVFAPVLRPRKIKRHFLPMLHSNKR